MFSPSLYLQNSPKNICTESLPSRGSPKNVFTEFLPLQQSQKSFHRVPTTTTVSKIFSLNLHPHARLLSMRRRRWEPVEVEPSPESRVTGQHSTREVPQGPLQLLMLTPHRKSINVNWYRHHELAFARLRALRLVWSSSETGFHTLPLGAAVLEPDFYLIRKIYK